MRPLIGVTTSEVRVAEYVCQTPEGEPPDREMALGLKYLRALELAGALPVVMPPLSLEAIEPLLANLSGICLSGGPDLDPGIYHSLADAHLGPTEPELDRFEVALARHADARNMPVLAICRGAQVLNVARGGTLHQHLPDVVGSAVVHRRHGPDDPDAQHLVDVEAESVLGAVLGHLHPLVNSYHHQAADRLGRGLRAVAWSPDGVIEGIEAPGRDFVIGVQWHAESLSESETVQADLLAAFIAAAANGRRVEAVA